MTAPLEPWQCGVRDCCYVEQTCDVGCVAWVSVEKRETDTGRWMFGYCRRLAAEIPPPMVVLSESPPLTRDQFPYVYPDDDT